MATQNNVLYMKRFILLSDYVYVFNEIHFLHIKGPVYDAPYQHQCMF